MKGDASIWSMSRFWINVRRIPSTRVALRNEMRDAYLVRVSPILGKGRHAY
jgi:hypothetical protein